MTRRSAITRPALMKRTEIVRLRVRASFDEH
jgi:hypothetical protein